MSDTKQRHRTAREVILVARAAQAERQAQWDRVDEFIRRSIALTVASSIEDIRKKIDGKS